MSEPAEFLFDPAPHTDAADFISSKPVVSREVYAKLLPELRARAFTVAGVETASVVQGIRDRIAEIPQGGDWDTIKQQIADDLHPFLANSEDPDNTVAADRRAELLVRTHGFQAYQASSHEVMTRQTDVFPYWQYLSMEDGRVRVSHAALDHKVIRHDDPFWQNHFPPWEWGCRCQAVPLSQSDVDEMTAQDQDKPMEQRRVLEQPVLDQIHSTGQLHLGPTQIFDLRTAQQKGDPHGYQWSPTDLRIPLDQLQSRYDSSTWGDFQAWARKTEIEGGISVWAWLSRQAGFAAPELTGRDGHPIEVSDARATSLAADFDADGEAQAGAHFSPGQELDTAARAALEKFEAEIASKAREHARIYAPDGRVVWSQAGDAGRVTVPQADLAGHIFTHNHPGGTPFSLQDLVAASLGKALEARVVTPAYLYAMRPAGATFSAAAQIRTEWDSITEAAWAVAREAQRSRGQIMPDAEAFSRMIHSVLMDLGRQGLIQYRRTVR